MRTRKAEAYWIESEKRWKISVSREGIRKCFADSTRGRAGKHLAEAKADKWLRTFESEQRFGDAVELYLADRRKQLSPAAYKTLDVQFHKHILPCFPEARLLSRISPYDWQRVLDRFAEAGHTPSYTNLFVTAIKNFITYCDARMWEITLLKPGQLVVTSTKEKHEKKSLEAEQIKRLLALSAQSFKHISVQQFVNLFRLSLVTGLRRGELLGLKWDDITDDTISVNRAVSPTGELTQGKTANSRRVIPQTQMSKDILQEQAQFQSEHGATEWVFGDWVNGWEHTLAPDRAGTAWRTVRKEIGAKDISVHELRHTFISMFKADMPLTLLKQTVGHSQSMDTVGVYGHQTADDLAKTGQIISDKLSDWAK